MGSASVEHVSSLRCEVQKLLEWQRHHQHSKIEASEDATASNDDAKDENKPSIDAHAALQAAFDVLLQKNSHDNAQSSTAESDAFRIVTMVVQLDGFTLLPEEQTKIAEIVHQLWFSTSPGVACRTLLEDMLARKSNDTAVFVDQLLRILQQTFTVGNKRSLQILIHLFDVVDNSLLEDCFPDLVDKLAECITTQSGAQQAARILSKIALVRSGHDTKVLLDFLKPFIIQETHRAKQAVYENLLPPVLSQVPELQQPLLQWLQESACTSTNHLYALLVLARLCPPSEAGSDNNVSEYDDLISPSLVHEDALIRFEAFRLLSTLPYGPSPSRRFHLPHLALHSMFWKYNLTDSDSPAVRTGLIGEWKQFIIRARLSSNAARRIVVKYQKRPEGEAVHPDVVGAQQYIDAVQAFFVDWTASTTRQLIPVKPYRCQISALLFLQILLEHGLDTRYANGSSTASTKAGRAKEAITWPFEVRIVSRSFTESLITCMRSTYEDIRNLAQAILANITLEADHLQLVRDLGFLLVQRKREADIASGTLYLRLISTARSSMSEYDMLGSIIPHLLGLLEMRLVAFRTSLAETADQWPVHGIFQSIAHLLQNSTGRKPVKQDAFGTTCRRCVSSIYAVWEVTKPVLCRSDVDSAEEGNEGGEDSSDQVILNASWRSIKEASNLLSVILSTPAAGRDSLWSPDELSEHASLFSTWLLEIKHRGVFAHVSQAYSRLCMSLAREKGPAAQLPTKWLKEHLYDVLQVERPPARRSAGLPYLLLGAMSSFSAQSAPLQSAFDMIIDASSKPSTQSSDVIRTHAIHSLRVLLQDGRMTASTKPYIQAAFSVAIPGFGSKHWGVRNASLLLYAALIQRLFSNRKENHLPLSRRTSIVDFFGQYGDLVPELVAALASGVGKTEPEALGSVFSVLLLLSLLATPSDSSKAREIVAAFLPHVDACISSPVWKVRKTAAAAFTGLVSESDVHQHCNSILARCADGMSSNELHGRCMQVHALLSSHTEANPTTKCTDEKAWSSLLKSLDAAMHRDHALPILTQALEILILSPIPPNDNISAKLHTLACRHYGQRRPGYETYSDALTRALLKVEPERYLDKCLASQYTSSQAEALSYLKAVSLASTSAKPAWYSGSLQNMLRNSDAAVANRVHAADILANSEDINFTAEDFEFLEHLYRKAPTPALRQALLPLLAKSANSGLVNSGSRSFVWDTICQLGCDESSAARHAACLAMSLMHCWRADDSFDFHRQLLCFLQDDDIDVRRSATGITSALLAQHQPLCTSRAVELVWHFCKTVASGSDAQTLLQELGEGLEDATEAAEAGSHMLFAVERSNMHLDITLDLDHQLQIITQAGLRTEDVKSVSAIVSSCQDRLQQLVDKVASVNAAESHEVQKAYTFVQARMLLQKLLQVLE